MPHPPQCPWLVCVFTQPPAHGVWFCGHSQFWPSHVWQTPPMHEVVGFAGGFVFGPADRVGGALTGSRFAGRAHLGDLILTGLEDGALLLLLERIGRSGLRH